MAYLDVVSDPLIGLVPRDRVTKIREGNGPLDRAEDFVAIDGVFTEFAGALAGKHPFSAAQLARLADVGAALLQQMRPGNAPKEERTRGPEATLRDQFAALVTARFEHLLELATLVPGARRPRPRCPRSTPPSARRRPRPARRRRRRRRRKRRSPPSPSPRRSARASPRPRARASRR